MSEWGDLYLFVEVVYWYYMFFLKRKSPLEVSEFPSKYDKYTTLRLSAYVLAICPMWVKRPSGCCYSKWSVLNHDFLFWLSGKNKFMQSSREMALY